MERKTVWKLMLTGCALIWIVTILGLNKILAYLHSIYFII
ncbi:hypothetical protein BW31_01441 [Pantoea agglomerans]|nr:hypothetical protein BW31_01441 [Pantoea agglomerans]